MHRLVITAKLAPGTTHQQIARFISQNRPAMQQGGATGMMIRCGGTLKIILEGPEAVMQATANAARSSGLFTSADTKGAVPIRFRAFDKICLAYAKPEHLDGSLRREIGLLTGLELPQQPLAA